MIANPKTAYSKRDKFKDDFGGSNNEVYTPKEAIYPLLPFLNKSSVIFDCAFGTGRLAEHFSKEGFTVIGNRNIDFLGRKDFEAHLGQKFDIIITNPPYSFKDEFLEKAFRIEKPFAFLLPLTTLEGIRRGKMFKDNGIQIIIPNRRINFEIPSGKKSSWFATAWFTWGLNLPKDLNFVELNRYSFGKKVNKNEN